MTSAKHAVTLRATCGAEILIHVGLETVALAGEGFVAHVREGRSVRTGDPLLTFDLDFLASQVKSLISPIVVTNGDDFDIVRREARPRDGGRRIPDGIEAARGASGGTDDAAASEEIARRRRASGTWHPCTSGGRACQRAKRFGCEIALVLDGRRVNAKSVVALMSLGVRKDAPVTVAASGRRCAQGRRDVGRSYCMRDLARRQARQNAGRGRFCRSGRYLRRRNACAVCLRRPASRSVRSRISNCPISPSLSRVRGIAHEAAELAQALVDVRTKLELQAGIGDRQRRDILGAHIALLDDPELVESRALRYRCRQERGFRLAPAPSRNYAACPRKSDRRTAQGTCAGSARSRTAGLDRTYRHIGRGAVRYSARMRF